MTSETTFAKNSKTRPLKGQFLRMKNIKIVLLLSGIALFLYAFISFNLWKHIHSIILERLISSSEAAEVVETSVQAHSVFAEKLDPIYEVPVRIYAKKQSSDQKIIDADMVTVNLTSEGQLETPSDWSIVGWYERSAKVGEEGNALVNGHYDDNYGRPAAFFNLKSLEVNDTVYLVDSFGRNFVYRITEIFHVSIYDKDRVTRVLESEGSFLTLITCGGVWTPSEGTYSNRLVVKAQLKH